MTFWQALTAGALGGALARASDLHELAACIFVVLLAWLFFGRNDSSHIDDAVDRGLERFARRHRR